MIRTMLASAVAVAIFAFASASAVAADDVPKAATTADVLAAAKDSDWRTPDPENVVYMDLPDGRVIFELAPAFAPLHVDNIRKLIRLKYFDGLAIVRVQDGFVTQWGDPNAGEANARSLGDAKKTLPSEFTRPSADLPFTILHDGDVYAPQVGHSNGFPTARDPASGEVWMAHCYGVLGVGRDTAPESGSGAELYVVIGQAPRQLDRNIATVGRVLRGMEWLTAFPRGTGPLGFYEQPAQRTPIKRVRLADDVPVAERVALQVLKTDTPTFTALVESRRNRRDEWYHVPAGKIDLCNVPIPVRDAPATKATLLEK
ncbi:MAG: peptidylprolyl isomerase [Dokdonella sp.]